MSSFKILDTMSSLSGADAVQAILADVPLYAAGVFALGMFTFYLILQRVSWTVATLHLAVLLAFIAGILDLSQVLLRFGVNAQPTHHWPTISGLIRAREVFLALSFGLRFGFFWLFVAQPPIGEQDCQPGLLHSGSWERWGMIGLLLKWTLAPLCVAIGILQILFRLVSSLNGFGPVYEVENTVEIVTSACFMLKLMLNGYLTVVTAPPGRWRWKPCVAYIPVLVALGMNAAIGAGNMITFLWSETIIGRLVQAAEYYILIVTLGVYMFNSTSDHLRPLRTKPQLPQLNRSSSFHNIGPTRSIYRPDPRSSGDTQGSQKEKAKAHSRGGSIADRLSTFLSPRPRGAVQLPESPTLDKLWNREDVERAMTPSLYSTSSPIDPEMRTSRASFDESPSEPKQSAKWRDPLFSSVLSGTSPNEVLADAALQPPVAALPPLTIPARTFSPASASNTDSPIYGINGRQLIQPQSLSSLTQSPLSNSSKQLIPDSQRSSTYMQVLRQQAELDKSIASLRALARDTYYDSPTVVNSATTADGKPASASNSEFSLSNFPAPPWRNSTDTDYTVRPQEAPVVTISRAEAYKSQAVDVELLPPRMPVVAEHARNISVPFSDNDDPLPTGRIRVDSEGTEYEITSFIGHLTHKKDGSNGTFATNSTAASPQRANVFPEGPPDGSPPRLASSIQFPLPPRTIIGRPIGLPSRPRLAAGAVHKMSPLAESATSPEDMYENPRRAPSPSPLS